MKKISKKNVSVENFVKNIRLSDSTFFDNFSYREHSLLLKLNGFVDVIIFAPEWFRHSYNFDIESILFYSYDFCSRKT